MGEHYERAEHGRRDAGSRVTEVDALDGGLVQVPHGPSLRYRVWRTVRTRILTPRTIISAVLGFGLLAAVLALGDPAEAWRLIVRTGWRTMVPVILLTVPYLSIRFFVWRSLLADVDVTLYWRPILTAFAAGEFSKSLPGGIYVEDYLLKRCCDVPISTSVISTTAISALEIFTAVPVVLILGIPGWEPALRLTLAGILAVYGIAAGVVWWLANPNGEKARVGGTGLIGGVIEGVRSFLVTARPLIRWVTLRNLPPIALSLAIVAFDIMLLGRSSGIHGLSFLDALVVYSFITLTLTLTPVPTDLGTTEAGGAGALLAFGATAPEAVATLLLLRILLTGSTMVITGITMLALARRWV